MEGLRKNILFATLLLSAPQLVAYLIDLSHGLALFLGLAALAYYFFHAGYLSKNEVAAGFTGFLVSSFAFSAAGKILILDDLCRTAQSMRETGSPISGMISPDEVCRGFIENWFAAVTSNPVWNWYFWVFAVLTGVISMYGYMKYGGQYAGRQ